MTAEIKIVFFFPCLSISGVEIFIVHLPLASLKNLLITKFFVMWFQSPNSLRVTKICTYVYLHQMFFLKSTRLCAVHEVKICCQVLQKQYSNLMQRNKRQNTNKIILQRLAIFSFQKTCKNYKTKQNKSPNQWN